MPPVDISCERNPSHGASIHIVTARPDGRGMRITAHVCADDLEGWISTLQHQDGHEFVLQQPINDDCRPYGLCATR